MNDRHTAIKDGSRTPCVCDDGEANNNLVFQEAELKKNKKIFKQET